MQNTNQTVILAVSILIGFALIAAAIFFSNTVVSSPNNVQGNIQGQPVASPDAGSVMRTDEAPRRVYGNPDASTTIVGFSDFECPFCARLHPTLMQVVDESDGNINWEYRHLPLSIHATALPAAIASECVGDLLGNDAFWNYSTALLSNQRGLTTSFLEEQAIKLGADASDYKSCLTSKDIAARVQTDSQRAIALGGSGAPFNIVIFEDGTTQVASGALPYANWIQLLGSKQ